MNDDEMVSAMASGLVRAVGLTSHLVRPPVEVLSFEIYPWHQYLAFSILDATGSADHARWPAEWPLFEVASSFDSGLQKALIAEWEPVARAMDEAINDADDDDVERGRLTDHFHGLAAAALTHPAVTEALVVAGWTEVRLQVINVDDPDERNFVGRTD